MGDYADGCRVALATALITIVRGFAAVAYTDAIHAPILIVGSAAVLGIGLWKVGGWTALCSAVQHTAVPNAMHMHRPFDDPIYPFWGIILCGFYGGNVYWGIDKVNIQRVLGAKDLRHGAGERCLRSCSS